MRITKLRQRLKLFVSLNLFCHWMDNMIPLFDFFLLFNHKRNDFKLVHNWAIQCMDSSFNCILIFFRLLFLNFNSLTVIELILVAFAFLADLIQKPWILKHLPVENFSIVQPKRADAIGKVSKKERSYFHWPFVLGVPWKWFEELLEHILRDFLGIRP